MATEVVRDLADTIIGTSADAEDTDSNQSTETVIRAQESVNKLGNESSYLLTNDDSVFSRDVDHWIRGDTPTPTDTGVQGSRVATAQRSTLVSSSSLDATGVWYLAAMVLPFMNLNNTMLWRCTPSTVLNTAELLLTHVAHLCARARSQLRRLVREQAARDVFAATMDIVLVVYALGFLVLSMYQASIIGP